MKIPLDAIRQLVAHARDEDEYAVVEVKAWLAEYEAWLRKGSLV